MIKTLTAEANDRGFFASGVKCSVLRPLNAVTVLFIAIPNFEDNVLLFFKIRQTRPKVARNCNDEYKLRCLARVPNKARQARQKTGGTAARRDAGG